MAEQLSPNILAKYIVSTRGNMLIAVGEFIFRKTKVSKGISYWICTHYDKNKCRCSLKVIDGSEPPAIQQQSQEHNHCASFGTVEAKQIIQRMKIRSCQSNESPSQIYASTMASAQLSPLGAIAMGRKETVKRTIIRTRNKNNQVPSLPRSLQDLDITPLVKDRGLNLMVYDSGRSATNRRFVVFSNDELLDKMESSIRKVSDNHHKPVMSAQGAHVDVSSLVNKKGEFVRNASSFRQSVSADGSTGFLAEAGRYHLYVSLACPWAHRTLIVRKLKGLEDVISFTVVDFLMLENGWRFNENVAHCSKDPVYGAEYMREVYSKASPGYEGRITVPVLFDKKTKSIVNNESSEIIRMLSTEFNQFCTTEEQKAVDIYPEALRKDIDSINDWVYPYINNGVYRSGFARSQEAYDKAVGELFEHLDKAEEHLGKSRYLVGDKLTEADIRLFTTLVRFDKVYHGHFKCNKRQLKDYENLWAYLRDLYQRPAFRDTTDFDHIMKHYMMSHRQINPLAIVSIGPDLDFDAPHGRDIKFSE